MQHVQQHAQSIATRPTVESMKDETKAIILWAVGFLGMVVAFVQAMAAPSEAPSYPTPLVVWANAMHGRIEGAQCEKAGDAMVCDVRLDGVVMAKVHCAGQKCWLQWTQGSCPGPRDTPGN